MIGVDLDGYEKAYDLIELQNRRIVNDQLGPHAIVAMTDADKTSAFVYDSAVDGKALNFELKEDRIIDVETGSVWDHLGRCQSGKHKGAQLVQLQSYRQFIRAWITFHPETEFYEF